MRKLKLGLLIFCLYAGHAFAGPNEQAMRLYQSLTGAQPKEAEIKLLAAKISAGKYDEAARDIIESRNGIDSQGAFYNITVKNFATPWSNRAKTKMFDLNDLSATVIGWVRDEKKFNDILWADSVYMGNGVGMSGALVKNSSYNANQAGLFYSETKNCGGISGVRSCSNCSSIAAGDAKGRIVYVDPKNPNGSTLYCRLTKYSKSEFNNGVQNDHFYIPHLDVKLTVGPRIIKHSNTHYEEIEALGLDLSDKDLLVENSQTKLHQDEKAIGGIMTTRGWGMAYMTAGTNRRNIMGAMEHFFCKEMMDLNDTQISDHRVRQDVDRAPGGSPEAFQNLCVGCHAGMDALAGAFAYYDFPTGAIVYNQGEVVEKMTHNKVFTEGYVTQNDTWTNLWTDGLNSSMGWGDIPGGEGVKSLGQMFAQTKEFPSCMAKQVFETTCFKEPTSADEKKAIDNLAKYFIESNYNMKKLFMKTAVVCMGQ